MTATNHEQPKVPLSAEAVVGLYAKYRDDLIRVRRELGRLYRHKCVPWRTRSLAHRVVGKILKLGFEPTMLAQGDDESMELLYMLVREERPRVVVEISPFHGWSSCWILSALRDNAFGRLHSYDLLSAAKDKVPEGLQRGRWELTVGDVRRNHASVPSEIDFLLMDSDHSSGFAQWYLREIVSRVHAGSTVVVDDIFHSADPTAFDGEGGVVMSWLGDRGIDYFTLAKSANPSALNAVRGQKVALGMAGRIHVSDVNPSIFFRV